MRIEITPVYKVDVDELGETIAGTKELISVRKRAYLPDEGTMFAEWLLDWATGEWRPVIEMPQYVEINDEMRKRLDWGEVIV